MSKAQDPFYIVKEEIQDSIDKLQSSFHQWERVPGGTGEQVHLTKELLANCESIAWQLGILLGTASMKSSSKIEGDGPAMLVFRVASLLSGRKKGARCITLKPAEKWMHATSEQRNGCPLRIILFDKVADVKRTIGAGKENDNSASVICRELMRLPNSQQPDISDHYSAKNNDDFVASESDRQMLLLKQQDEELDELSTSVKRIGGVGLTIHEELLAQEKILDELGTEMDSTKNRLDFVQKKMGMVMKKAGAKGQIMIIIFLLVLFIILFILVFFT
ncbi:hypothetical protein GOBAR_AA04120 [Gossypium barbadense]|uniref:t-SNARE coiled-coil homology domain-containing protein n=1 Tax=Gossypium barbadense TaxID=3634 RepID=A0A2P5YLM9_GOSBA|nr:hypothetical protein GOBAR_AA04120 [Gossypium barbadense]